MTPSNPGLPPLPQGGGLPPQAPATPPGPGSNVSSLTPGQPLAPAGPTPDQRVAGYFEQVRNLSIQIDALASQFPDASQDLDTAKTALLNSMSKVATAMSQPSGGNQPPTF